MARLGTTKRPAVARVRTQKRAEEIISLCNEHNIKVIVGIEPDNPEDISDVELALSPPKAVAADAKIGRPEPFPSGSGNKYQNAPAPKQRVDFATLPPGVQEHFSAPQCAAFADAEFTVDAAEIQVTSIAAGGSRNMAESGAVGHVEEEPDKIRQTDIRLQLSDPRGSQSRARARKRCSFSVTAYGQSPIHIEPGDTVRLVFVAAFAEGDAPDDPKMPWHPILLANCATGQHVMFGTVPHLKPPPLLTVLKVAIGLVLVAGLGLAAYALHRQHRFSFFVGALGCMALACWLKRKLNQAQEWAKQRLERLAQLARDYPLQKTE
jgi:hypothetical protein